ncbi:MAG: helix-turn-helix domain-containing protein [Chthoniobacterales bacterium]|nr:helix-turn-helix domain-containing protein [Chthoniobacterales bacterium]
MGEPNPRPVNLRDVAAAVGCSSAAVSLALRNLTRVSPQRRAEIQAVTREVGYCSESLGCSVSFWNSTEGRREISGDTGVDQ